MVKPCSDPYLLLWLEAPLQSWGANSLFDLRDTLAFPTKSGVLGLICCARGEGGEQENWLSHWVTRDMQVISYSRNEEGQRKTPLLEDFHTVGVGYDYENPWEMLLIPKKSDGKRPVGTGAKVTYRYYLQDAAFAVLLQGEQAMLEEVAAALQAPIWDVYLGRKTCAPTELIYQGIFDTAELASEKAKEIALAKSRYAAFTVYQGKREEGEVFVLNDNPIRFGEEKAYSDRSVTLITTDLGVNEEM